MAERQYVVFRLDGQAFGADIQVVREVTYVAPLVHLPNTPDYVEGVMDLRGEVLPVVNMRKRLHLAERESDQHTRVMILNLGDRSAALLVDGVDTVITLDDADIVPPDQSMVLVGEDYVAGVGRKDGKLVVIMDLNRLMTPAMA